MVSQGEYLGGLGVIKICRCGCGRYIREVGPREYYEAGCVRGKGSGGLGGVNGGRSGSMRRVWLKRRVARLQGLYDWAVANYGDGRGFTLADVYGGVGSGVWGWGNRIHAVMMMRGMLKRLVSGGILGVEKRRSRGSRWDYNVYRVVLGGLGVDWLDIGKGGIIGGERWRQTKGGGSARRGVRRGRVTK